MVRCKSLAIIGVTAMLPFSAWAGTPADEADRCSRYLAAIVHADPVAASNLRQEHLKPGETSDRFRKSSQAALKTILGNIEKRGGVQKVEPLPDYVVPDTGDIIRREKWTDGKGAVSFIACASYQGKEEPWELQVLIGGNDASNIAGMSKAIVNGEPDPSWYEPRPIQ